MLMADPQHLTISRARKLAEFQQKISPKQRDRISDKMLSQLDRGAASDTLVTQCTTTSSCSAKRRFGATTTDYRRTRRLTGRCS